MFLHKREMTEAEAQADRFQAPRCAGSLESDAGLVGAHWSVPDLIDGFSGSCAEVFWMLGGRAAAILRDVGGTLPIRYIPSPHAL